MKGQGLALAAGEEPHVIFQTVLKAHVEEPELLPEELSSPPVEADAETLEPFFEADHHVVLQGHVGGGAGQGILENAADGPGADVFRRPGDILAIQNDATGVRGHGSGQEVEQGAFSRPVAADDGDKVPLVHREIEGVEDPVFVGRSGVEGEDGVFYGDHLAPFAGFFIWVITRAPIMRTPETSFRSLGVRWMV